MVNDLKQLEAIKNDKKQTRYSASPTTKRIIQRYITNPLLINGYKFDVRAYMLIASTEPYIVFYHPGYVRLTCEPYSTSTLDLHVHLTNQYVQKKHHLYAEKKEVRFYVSLIFAVHFYIIYICLIFGGSQLLRNNLIRVDLTCPLRRGLDLET